MFVELKKGNVFVLVATSCWVPIDVIGWRCGLSVRTVMIQSASFFPNVSIARLTEEKLNLSRMYNIFKCCITVVRNSSHVLL